MQETDRLLGMGGAHAVTGNSVYVHRALLLERHAATDASSVVHRSITPTPESVSGANGLLADAPEDPRLQPTQAPPVPPLGIAGPRMPMVAADTAGGTTECHTNAETWRIAATLSCMDTCSVDASPAVLPSEVQRNNSWIKPTGTCTPVVPAEEPDAETAWHGVEAQQCGSTSAFEDTEAEESDTSTAAGFNMLGRN